MIEIYAIATPMNPMAPVHCFEQAITIRASVALVEHCVTDLTTMEQWLNPWLRCRPVGEHWSTQVGARSRFSLRLFVWQPGLISTVVERSPNAIVWTFDGFFRGQDQWQWQARGECTELINRFEFTIPNALVEFGFNRLAADWTRADMGAQLDRLKKLAETQVKSSRYI